MVKKGTCSCVLDGTAQSPTRADLVPPRAPPLMGASYTLPHLFTRSPTLSLTHSLTLPLTPLAATSNNSPYIWAAWGWLEFKTGNIAAARKLFDAAVVVDPSHACAWHKWGMLERAEGNYMRARDLWMQGIQKCRRRSQSQNAYLYNALAVMAAQVRGRGGVVLGGVLGL